MTTFSHQLALPASLADTVGSGMLICPKCRTTYSSTALTTCYRDGQRLVDYERFVAAERDPLRGVLIGGKYKLIERVGQGGMGTIYRAQQAGVQCPLLVSVAPTQPASLQSLAMRHSAPNSPFPTTDEVPGRGTTQIGA